MPSDRRRAGAYDAVAAEDWDMVVEVSRQPGQVSSAVAALRDRAARYQATQIFLRRYS